MLVGQTKICIGEIITLHEFNNTDDTYEHQTLFYNYDGKAWSTSDAGYYQTNLPDPYLDTQFLNDSGIAGSSGEVDITVGTYDPDTLAASTWYYSTVKLKNTSSSSSMYKISGQEGNYWFCPDKNCVDGTTSAIYIPYKSGFLAPEVNRNFKYEWESNNTMGTAADSTAVNDWSTGTIKDSADVDYWDMDISSGRYYRFIMKVPKVSYIDYDIGIYSDSGTLIAKLNNGAETDEVKDVWLNPGHYYIKVYPYKGYDQMTQYHWISYPN